MQPTSERFQRALSASQTPFVIATVDGIELPVLDGSVNLDAQAATRASLSLTLALGDSDLAEWVPDAPEHALAPYGNEIVVSRGFTYTDETTETVPLGVFRIDETSVEDSGEAVTVTVNGLDRSAQIIDAVFEDGGSIAAGVDAAELIWLLVVAGGFDGTHAPDFFDMNVALPALSWEASDDRWDFCRGLAEAIYGASLYFDGSGVLTLRQLPDSASVDFTVTEGEGGNLLGASKRWSREDACNRVVATGETSTETPVVGIAIDDVPGSPTNYYASDFGRLTFAYSSEYIINQDQADSVAETILSQKLGTGQQISFDSLVNPALEPGDVIEVVRERIGVAESHIIDSIQIPLSHDGPMSCQTRVARVTS